MRDHARLSLSTMDTDKGIHIGRSDSSLGSFVQEGGLVEAVGRFYPGYQGYGAYELLGGRLVLPYGAANTRYRLAVQNNATGLFYQRGGAMVAAANGLNGSFHFEIGSGKVNANALYYADGGVARIGVEIKILSGAESSDAITYNEMTVAGSAVVETPERVYLRANSQSYPNGASILNLNSGGLLRAYNVQLGRAATGSGYSFFNADGGCLELTNSGDVRGLLETVSGNTVIYEGGFEVRTSGEAGTTRMKGHLRGAKGWGVESVSIVSSGSGYLAPPRVIISGGSGSNATAVAFIDHVTGAVTGAVVTCRGEGYTPGDTLTVAISGGGGSDATATATLKQNHTGPLVKSGAKRLLIGDQPLFDGEYHVREGLLSQASEGVDVGAPHVTAIYVGGENAALQLGSGGSAATNNTPARWDLVNPEATMRLGGECGGGTFTLACGASDTVFRQTVSKLELGLGRNALNTTVQTPANGAELTAGDVVRYPGSMTRMTNLRVRVTGDVAPLTFGSHLPVLAGFHSGNGVALMTLDADGYMVPIEEYDNGFGTESNVWLQTSTAMDSLAANSLVLADGVNLTLPAEGVTVLGSGMLAADTASTSVGTVVAGGTLTSGNGSDLILYDYHRISDRRNNVSARTGLTVDAVIADNDDTPIALTAVGRAWSIGNQTLQSGPAIALQRTDNTYSGGTYIIDTLLSVAGDGSLGVLPATPTTNIFTSGMAILRTPDETGTVTLHANRHIRVCGGSLTFIGDNHAETQYGRELFHVQGGISGKGALVMNHWIGNGVLSAVRLSGDLSGFEGAMGVMGILRVPDAGSLPRKAALLLCDKSHRNPAGGILETAGVFTRTTGSGAGQVTWGHINTIMPGFAGTTENPGGGGFSAYGGPLTVNLGGDRRKLTLGQDGFNPARLRLQSDYATDTLTWENPVDVTNDTLTVQVANTSSKCEVIWRGGITSSSPDGGGRLVKTGNGRLIVADADIGPIDFEAHPGNTNSSEIVFTTTNRQTLACNISGNYHFVHKYGPGTTVMEGINSYNNATRIYEGVLLINGVNTNGNPVSAQPGGVLGGSGHILPKINAYVTIKEGGTIAPSAQNGPCCNLTIGSESLPSELRMEGGDIVLTLDLTTHDSVTVYGNFSLYPGSSAASTPTTVKLTARDEAAWQIRRGEEIPLVTWTGTKTGSGTLVADTLPTGWKVREKPGMLYAIYVSSGTLMSIK
ncbi:MAG TPA: hypothetical protein P5026_06640 [Kiritimatiellia bacterium]|nr:hypothetical protein [Kiritimatiellia bacterium]HRU70695.1 hypothetical protein [Kiritimatiellia bacterium]